MSAPSLRARLLRRAPLLALAVAACLAVTARADLPPLIPRDVLLGNPSKSQARISPNGTRIAYLGPSDKNVLNVWVRTIGKTDDRMVTADDHRGIRTYFWAEDGKHLICLQDVGGDENFHAYRVDLGGTAAATDLTPFEGARAQNIMLDRKHPNEMLVGLNQRDKKVFDMYRINLETGESKLDTQNPGDVSGWLTDPRFVIRAAVASDQATGAVTLRVRDGADAPWRDLVTWPFEESGGPVDFTPDGRSLYVETSIGSDVTRLVRLDAATGKELEVIASDPRCDVGEEVVNPNTHKLQAVSFEYTRREWKAIDPALRTDLEALKRAQPGDFTISSRDREDDRWTVAYTRDDGPVHYAVYDRKAMKLIPLFVSQPELEKYPLAKMEPVVIPTRDGLQMVSYLTLPAGVDAKNLPLVLLPHGGPWARDFWGLSGQVQWLSNRGYAVLQPNFRASTGFGKKFLHAGDKQWGQTMQDDLTDAVQWAIQKGIADPKRVAIMGGSYGGYATLAGLAFTPDLYACGVDIVGPSNLKTLLEATPAYWATMRKQLYLRMGEVDRDSLFNRKVSPLYHVDQVRAPLLIGQGANDPRVNIRESNQMVEAMRAKGLPVEYVVYQDEGHGFARPQNRLDFYGRAEQFLAKYLGGRAEPFAPVEGATADLK